MNLKEDLQKLNDKLEKTRRKLEGAKLRKDRAVIQQFLEEENAVIKQIDSLKGLQTQQNSSKAAAIAALAFNRPLTKAEQADMGKFKKSVKGIVVVHPLTALGREMGIIEVTGYAPKAF